MNAGELFKVNIEGQEHTKCIVQDMHAFTRNFTRKLTKRYGIVDITNVQTELCLHNVSHLFHQRLIL